MRNVLNLIGTALARETSKCVMQSPRRFPQRSGCRFTVGYHGAPQPGVWYDLVVYLHLQELTERIDKMLASRSREAGRILDTATTTRSIWRGAWLNSDASRGRVELTRVTGSRLVPGHQEHRFDYAS